MVASPQCPLLFHLAKAILVYELREQQPTLASSCAIATEPPITIASGQAELNLRKIAFGQRKKRDALQLGTGVNVCFQCEDALALYREFKSRGIQTRKRPSVGNRLWVVPLTDPDGYRIEFSSPTDAPEESELEE